MLRKILQPLDTIVMQLFKRISEKYRIDKQIKIFNIRTEKVA